VLAADISDRVEVFNPHGEITGSVSLNNVFIEFSPLEKTGWENLESASAETELLRAVWLRRRGSCFVLHLVYHLIAVKAERSANGPARLEQHIQVYGPLLCEIDPGIRRFRVRNAHAEPSSGNLLSAVRKPLFGALTILRELSDIFKVSAILAAATRSRTSGTWKLVVKFCICSRASMQMRPTSVARLAKEMRRSQPGHRHGRHQTDGYAPRDLLLGFRNAAARLVQVRDVVRRRDWLQITRGYDGSSRVRRNFRMLF
jgi:hypothetical protein